MKKILVVLLILAVAGGVFAQGNWSVNGRVELGATMDFNVEGGDDDPIQFIPRNMAAYAGGNGGSNRAMLGVNYGLDGFSAGLGFNTKLGQGIVANMSYSGDNFSLGGQARLNQFLVGLENNDPGSSWADELSAWGNYQMLNGMVDLLVAVNKYTTPWTSNLSVGIFRDMDAWGRFDLQGDSDGNPQYYPVLEQTGAFANFCCRSGIMANFKFSGIEFGAMLRSTPPRWADNGVSLFFWESPGTNQLDLIEDVLSKLILGLNFDFYPVNIAAQFSLDNYGAYVGLNWAFTDAISAGLSFLGVFEDDGNTDIKDTTAAFAASLGYAAGDTFGFKLEGGYYFDAALAEASESGTGGVVGIAPSVWFNVIPSHLRVSLNADFKFGEDGFGWRFVPGILYNFKGTGAGNWDTGIGIHYLLWKAYGATEDGMNNNEANITFRWNF